MNKDIEEAYHKYTVKCRESNIFPLSIASWLSEYEPFKSNQRTINE
jgi:hypothetical protein